MAQPGPADSRASRRTLLRGAAAVGVATPVLGACGSDQPVGAPPTGKGPGSSPDGPSTAGTALGPAAEVPVGGGKVYADQRVVVTQPRRGEFKAFSASCTHQGCLVGSVEGGRINCPCHGSQFDIASGEPLQGPSGSDPSTIAALPPADVSVEAGQVTLT